MDFPGNMPGTVYHTLSTPHFWLTSLLATVVWPEHKGQEAFRRLSLSLRAIHCRIGIAQGHCSNAIECIMAFRPMGAALP